LLAIQNLIGDLLKERLPLLPEIPNEEFLRQQVANKFYLGNGAEKEWYLNLFSKILKNNEIMEQINFLKMNGAGNDFVIIDNRGKDHCFSTQQIAKISDRKNIGCDQFIVLMHSKTADVNMLIYNADGSQSQACGNATRCVASLIMEEKEVDSINIETIAGILNCSKNGGSVCVNMGKPRFLPAQIPTQENLNTQNFKIESIPFSFSAVNIGNPHIVAFLDHSIEEKEFCKFGKLAECHEFFPEKTNVEFARVLSSNHIEVRVWERGVGETLACGSGACAVAVLAIKQKLVDKTSTIKISFKGGDLFVTWQDDSSILMSGPCEKIFSGTLDRDFFNAIDSK
jgi:diaminopimelate epimerase